MKGVFLVNLIRRQFCTTLCVLVEARFMENTGIWRKVDETRRLNGTFYKRKSPLGLTAKFRRPDIKHLLVFVHTWLTSQFASCDRVTEETRYIAR